MAFESRIIIAYSNQETTCELVKNMIEDRYLRVVACLNSGDKVLSLLKRFNPEFLILDSSLYGDCALDILRQVSIHGDVKPFIVMCCERQNDIYWQFAYKYKADLILEKPVDPVQLVNRLHVIIEKATKRTVTNEIPSSKSIDLEQKVTKVLHNLGLPAKFKGFHYLRSALLLIVADGEKLFSVTKILYPQVGEQYGVSSRSVEHSIQTAIQCIWSSSNKNYLQEVLGCNINNPPTNVEFITLISDAIRLNMI